MDRGHDDFPSGDFVDDILVESLAGLWLSMRQRHPRVRGRQLGR